MAKSWRNPVVFWACGYLGRISVRSHEMATVYTGSHVHIAWNYLRLKSTDILTTGNVLILCNNMTWDWNSVQGAMLWPREGSYYSIMTISITGSTYHCMRHFRHSRPSLISLTFQTKSCQLSAPSSPSIISLLIFSPKNPSAQPSSKRKWGISTRDR